MNKDEMEEYEGKTVVGATGDTSDINFYESDGATEKLTNAERELIDANWFGTNVTIGTAPSTPAETPAPTPTEAPTIVAASAPTSTATLIETPSLDLSSNPSTPTASMQGTESEVLPATPSKKDGLQDVFTTHNFIATYSLIGLLAFIYSLTLLKW
ncbi:MAG: hypothetical protein DNFNHJIP_00555 [Candidatus Argoarchaeum ethanivorans]|uniref:Uncharacterized protein n=1 Tax=Candidatus Argoarchaeum ethanivorans TaxID=2608793 RepID=A0A812A0S8_9EURY|nr:MAG: hypothetical protein DNFNHJIP_00555 [Candidatus Argoarchaeum ethanivorans]